MRYATFAIITQQILVSTRPAQTVADPWHLLPLHVPLPAEHFMCPPAVRIKAVADSALRCAGFSLLRVQQQCCDCICSRRTYRRENLPEGGPSHRSPISDHFSVRRPSADLRNIELFRPSMPRPRSSNFAPARKLRVRFFTQRHKQASCRRTACSERRVRQFH